ncbi:hypothetical protein [Deinococcus yavapaiensis]|uniref:Uncharacterized protein n=1 Tax=Deinococcus yavapaiensis KR-236 TaxID=694435 RepID=A0A318S1N5_9DEIO|nr:hypothetical protein [Deinococcus yavapaiensis]PYE48690.1 hypothetical protein DES52_12724 [Deinococcus yavapaiensis KR-236]
MEGRQFHNRIEFRVVENQTWHGRSIQILIDGRDLTDRLREYEVFLAWREANMHQAGRYAGVPEHHWRAFTTALLVQGNQEGIGSLLGAPGKVMVLTCECGEACCWPMFARVTLGNGVVTWDGFEQVYRPSWDYSRFGPFVFEPGQYRTAIMNLVRTLLPTVQERKSA